MTPRELDDVRRDERMRAHAVKRAAALVAIRQVAGNRESLTLAEVVALLPDNPEWNLYSAGKRGRT